MHPCLQIEMSKSLAHIPSHSNHTMSLGCEESDVMYQFALVSKNVGRAYPPLSTLLLGVGAAAGHVPGFGLQISGWSV